MNKVNKKKPRVISTFCFAYFYASLRFKYNLPQLVALADTKPEFVFLKFVAFAAGVETLIA